MCGKIYSIILYEHWSIWINLEQNFPILEILLGIEEPSDSTLLIETQKICNPVLRNSAHNIRKTLEIGKTLLSKFI